MAYSNIGRHDITYAKLLRLYPKTYRQQFAEPMLQMFTDMRNERAQNGHAARGLTWKIYAETLTGILIQHTQEIMMNIKSTKSKAIIGVSLIAIFAAVAILTHRPTAQAIQPGLGFKKVQQLSKGDKDVCLANNNSAANAVKQDDRFAEFKGTKFSNFESAAGIAISDVPAGTHYNLTINSYANKTVKGTLAYEKGYGTYNYTIKKLPGAGQWQLTSLVACKKS